MVNMHVLPYTLQNVLEFYQFIAIAKYCPPTNKVFISVSLRQDHKKFMLFAKINYCYNGMYGAIPKATVDYGYQK